MSVRAVRHSVTIVARALLPVAAIAVVAAVAAARQAATQPTADAPPAWRHATADLAIILSGHGTNTTLAALLNDETVIHRFNRMDHESPQQLCEQLSGLSVVYARGYGAVPPSLASDLAAAFKDLQLPDAVKKQFLVDDNVLRHANEAAVQWLNQTLEPSPTDLVGVILLFNQSASTARPTDSAAAPSAIQFVLFKGTTTANGGASITRVVFGDPVKLDD